MIRTRAKQQQKGPVQLDLFEPYQYGYEFKVIVTNKDLSAAALVDYHGGRGSQKGVFGELKTQCQMDYIPVRQRSGNETYLLAGLFAFNLIRDLQMQLEPPTRTTTRKRPTLWPFAECCDVPSQHSAKGRSPHHPIAKAGLNILCRKEPQATSVANSPDSRSLTIFATLGYSDCGFRCPPKELAVA